MPIPPFHLRDYIDWNRRNMLLQHFSPIALGACDGRQNLDGFVIAGGRSPYGSYCQFHRTGHVETVYGDFVDKGEGRNSVSAAYAGGRIVPPITQFLKGMQALQVPTPLYIAVSVVGVKGAFLTIRNQDLAEHGFDRDTLLLPGVILETYEDDPGRVMRPILDALWNAAGFERCGQFDEDGNWMPPRQ